MSASHLLLLTATITPPKGVPALARTDPDARRRDYQQAFRFYLDLLGRPLDRILFVENSGSDLSDLEALAREAGAADRVEFLSFHGLDFPPSFGRAYGEFRLLDHAAAHSRSLREPDDGRIVWKMTGRYLVRNLPALVASRPRSFHLYCNLRDYPTRWADMYLMAWNDLGFDGILRGLAPRLREDYSTGTSPEGLFRRVVDEARRSYKVVPRFRRVPVIDGVRGYNNRNYIEGEGRWKLAVRRVALRVTPWLWL